MSGLSVALLAHFRHPPRVSGSSTNNISSDATINSSVTNTGQSIDISGHTGGTITHPGPSETEAPGLTINSNSGATINFTGNLDASTGANAAFNATGGGTITATDTTSTLTTTTGT